MPTLEPTILITSFLVSWLKRAGPWVAPRASAAFLEGPGKHREVFLPFFYRWFDHRPWAADHAVRLLRATQRRDRSSAPRAFHAPFPGRRYRTLVPAGYTRDLAEAGTSRAHAEELRRECAFLGKVRREFGVPGPMLYVVHLGLTGGQSRRDALTAATETIRLSLEAAHAAGVVFALENVADRLADDQLGAALDEVGGVLSDLGAFHRDPAPVGFAFDITHALLAHDLDAGRVSAALEPLLPALVHLHVNAPRRDAAARGEWADRHEAPINEPDSFWELFRRAARAPRFQGFRTITYEVNWLLPGTGKIFGGSTLPDIARGYELLQEKTREAFAAVSTKP